MFLLEQSYRRKLLGMLGTSGVCSTCLLLICLCGTKTVTSSLLLPPGPWLCQEKKQQKPLSLLWKDFIERVFEL